MPFHEVRARFLGNIATPAVGVSPIKMVERLWSGELPEFNSIDAANELIGALIMGLWNRLTQHQERSAGLRSDGNRHRQTEILRAALREIGFSGLHEQGLRANNRAENSHQPLRRRERKMQGFKPIKSAQRFVSVHAALYNAFNVQRHLISRRIHRQFRTTAHNSWSDATVAAA